MHRFPAHGVRARGFSLLELLVVVAIVGVLASLSVATLTNLARAAGARDDARAVQLAFAGARTLAHQRNMPVLVRVKADAIELALPDFPPPPHGFLMTVPGWTTTRTVPLPRTVQIIAGGGLEAGGHVAFCPSGDYRFLDGVGDVSRAGAGGSVCGVGDMASLSGALQMKIRDERWSLELRAPLSSLELRTVQ